MNLKYAIALANILMAFFTCSLFAQNINDLDSFSYYKSHADKGDASARYRLGIYYVRGGDYQNAKKWLELSANDHYPAALTHLSYLYINGRAGETNFDKALKYLTEAADSNNSDAELEIGYLYDHGVGVTLDPESAEKWYRKSAGQNNPIALSNIGLFYHNGRGGLPKNDTLALPYYFRAADLGHAAAQFELGLMYEKGQGGLEPDTDKAFRWYDKAAKQGNAAALNNYAWLSYGKRRNINKGIQYIEVALRLAPNDIHKQDTYAALLFLGGIYDDAQKWERKALDGGGAKYGGYVERYGDILYKLNKKKEAKKYWKTALSLPGHSIYLFDKVSKGQYVD